MCITDHRNGIYLTTGTPIAGRADFFQMDDAGETYHIGTLVSGSRSKLDRFEKDCHRIVDALAERDARRKGGNA